MGNPLKDIFSTEMPTLSVSLKFKDDKAKSDFLEHVDSAVDNEHGVECDGVEKLTMYLETPYRKQVFDELDSITQFFISPSTEDVPIDIDTDFGKAIINFTRLHKKDEIVLKNPEDAIVHFKITIIPKTGTLNFSYTSNPLKADSIESIIHAYNTAKHFFIKLAGENANEDIKEAISSFDELEKYWRRVREIEKALNVTFQPDQINNVPESEKDVEELYLSIIRKKPLRTNLQDLKMSVDDGIADKIKANISAMRLSMQGTMKYTIYGADIETHVAYFIFNALYSDVVENQTNKHVVKLKGSEAEPLYMGYYGFKTAEEATDAMGQKELWETARTAKTFNDSIEEMKNEYVSSVRKSE